MLVTEMSREECQECLARLGFGRLACACDNYPYIVPTYFASEPGYLYGVATIGQKIEWMRSNPHVCVEADEVVNPSEWKSVIVQGRYEDFPDTPPYLTQRERAQALLEKQRSLWWSTAFASAQTRQRFDREMTVFYCIHIEKITGRRASPDPKEQG
jgi:nitroimidazol reductase NimA-like FMN-containing flavoprotein (pyridoxamine 5'-phosphate oxidase superfamily)